jgi:Sulfotransferase family
MAAPSQDFPEPVFVGGSARSGTHAIGRLLDSHPRYHLIAVESRFHCGTGGLTDLLNGATDLDAYCERVLGQWWQRGLQQHRGLQVIMERPELETAVERFREGFADDPWDSGRRLVRDLLDPSAARAGKPAWVDLSGSNIRQAPTLLRLFPRARFIHMVRDGRAVTAAILKKRDMTDDLEQAFGHWVARVRRSDEALRLMPPGAALTIYLDDLTAHDREAQFQRLVDYLELDDPEPMRDYFDETISPERAHVGAWRERMAPADARWVDRRYRRVVRKLRGEGIDWVPEPGGR